MSIVGIIAEYNPFHKGHAYHIAQAKALSGADACVVIMSPDFVQRGEPAVMSKYDRARAALASGADCVLEMPIAFATGAARTFAEAGVALLEKTGIVTHLCFGSECGDLEILSQIAKILAEEPAAYTAHLKENMKRGQSYPAANQRALADLLGDEIAAVAASPNNILAIEYLRALLIRHSSIRPITLKRTGDYSSQTLAGELSSASAIRSHLAQKHFSEPLSKDDSLFAAIPAVCQAIYYDTYQKSMPIFPDDFSVALNYRLLEVAEHDWTCFEDISDDLANQIKRNLGALSSFTRFAELCKSRQYTRTRLNRALLHILLNIQKEEVRAAQAQDYGSYIRILGFRESFKPHLADFKKKSRLTMITKVADAKKILSSTDYASFSQDLFASAFYQSVCAAKFQTTPYNEFTHGIIRYPDTSSNI